MKILEAKNITKMFPGVIALDSVDVAFEPGEIHAIMKTAHVREWDDFASAPKERITDRRGIAGDVYTMLCMEVPDSVRKSTEQQFITEFVRLITILTCHWLVEEV